MKFDETKNNLIENNYSLFDELSGLFAIDFNYRQNTLSLTASENYPSLFVRILGSALCGGFYYFDPPYKADPGEWFFPDSGIMDAVAEKLKTLGSVLFEGQTFDWRPNGGSSAEQAVLLGICERGDGFVHFAHKDGGHFGLEELAKKIGINIYHFPMIEKTLLIDVERLKIMIQDHPDIKLVIFDQSFKLRWQPILKISEELPDIITLSYDCSHDGGLIAGNLFPQPLCQGIHILHGNTHKTIPGPQKGFISFADQNHPRLASVSNWVCPYMQSNSHAELIAPMLIAFSELAYFGKNYAKQITKNAKAFAIALAAEGFFVSGESFGYTETHQVHLILGSKEKSLNLVSSLLPEAGIRVNNVEIPGSNGSFGLRFGTQAMTRRGMKEDDFQEVARILSDLILKNKSPLEVRYEVREMLKKFLLFPLKYSFDDLLYNELGNQLLREVLK
ncbi:hypothetical protein [Limnospira fusiformis]|uniref:hypothetical protein n=1 Tax=Limnospira fusiformis TaxID=54297 RepID=UPI001449C8EB|nr:hypothetical protein HFV01_13365 [Limnospira fusiformis SAG 85.79]